MNFRQGAFSARNVATLGILTALVIVFQLLAPFLNIAGTSLSLVLVPIVLGSILVSPWAGAFLGFVFSTVVFVGGFFGTDITYLMLQTNWFVTFLIIYFKGVLAGLMPGLVFKWLKGKNKHVAVLVSSLSAPVVNTGIFVLGALLSQNILAAAYEEVGITITVFLSIVLVNFPIELAINIIANPAIYTVVKVIEKKK